MTSSKLISKSKSQSQLSSNLIGGVSGTINTTNDELRIGLNDVITVKDDGDVDNHQTTIPDYLKGGGLRRSLTQVSFYLLLFKLHFLNMQNP